MNKIQLIRLFKKIVASVSVAAIVLTLVYIVPVLADTVEIWDGKTNVADVQYDGNGDGSEDNPFLISNGAQLYKMVSESKSDDGKLYFKLTGDIYLNDVSKANWKNNPNKWYSTDAPDNYYFGGVFDGAGYTIYGLYINGSNFATGLFPQLNSGAKVGNLTLSDAYLKTTYGYVGGIAGRIATDYSAFDVSLSAIAVVNTTIVGNGASLSSSGLVGLSRGKLSISNCYVRDCDITHGGQKKDAAAFVGDCYYPGTVSLRKAYSLGVFPVAPYENQDNHFALYTVKNVYTDTESVSEAQKAVTGITKISADDINGEAAETTLKTFDFSYTWETVENSAPVLIKKSGGLSDFDTTLPGQIWSGLPSENFGGGSGTEEDPWIIATGGHLAKLVKSVSEGETFKGQYFKMTENIYLNDTSYEGWQNDANQWYVSGVGLGSGFAGHFNGDGHIVSGMYISRNSGSRIYAGLFPTISVTCVIEKVGLVNSEVFLPKENFETVAGGIAGSVSSTAATVDEPNYAYISECFADSTVSLTGAAAAAMVCYGAQPVHIDNCYFTGTVDYSNDDCGVLMGHTWTYHSFVMNNCYVAAQVPGVKLGNSMFNTQKYANCYNLAFQPDAGVVTLYYVSKMNGEAAKDNLVGFDFDNIWVVRDGETPGLKAFEANKDLYSNKHDFDNIDEIHYTTITFVTYCDIEIQPIVGTMFEPIELPKMPVRNGYEFLGWYTDATLMLKYPLNCIPAYDITLYAKWELTGFQQGFESYPATEYDIDSDYEYYKTNSPNYSTDYVKSGAKSLHRLGKSTEAQDFLLNYEYELEVGKVYKMTFWATTDEESASVQASLVHVTWPDIQETDAGVSNPFKLNLTKGMWKQYTCNFTAQTKWISLRISGGHSVFFDEFFLYTNGEDGKLYNLKPVADEKNETVTPPTESNIDTTPITDITVSEESPEETNSESTNDSTPVKENQNKNTGSSEKPADNYWYLYVIIGVGVLIVVAAAVILVVSVKKKNKKK